MTQDQIVTEVMHLGFVALQALIMALVPILIVYAIQNIRNTHIRNYAMTLVRYAAQRLPDNSSKYTYVANVLTKHFRFLNERDVAHIIEAAVHAMKEADRTLNQTVALTPPKIEVTTPTTVVTQENGSTVKIEHQT